MKLFQGWVPIWRFQSTGLASATSLNRTKIDYVFQKFDSKYGMSWDWAIDGVLHKTLTRVTWQALFLLITISERVENLRMCRLKNYLVIEKLFDDQLMTGMLTIKTCDLFTDASIIKLVKPILNPIPFQWHLSETLQEDLITTKTTNALKKHDNYNGVRSNYSVETLFLPTFTSSSTMQILQLQFKKFLPFEQM